MTMKLLIATPLYPPEIGGPATYTKLLEEELPKRGVEFTLETFSSVRHLPKGVAHLAFFFQVFQSAYGKELIYVLDPSPAMLPAALAALVRGKPYALKIVGDIAWEQGQQRFGVKENLDDFVKRPDSKFQFPVVILRHIERFIARYAKTIIVPSEYLKRIVVEWGVPPEKITVVHNAFDMPEQLPTKEDVRKTLDMRGTTILSVGRLVPWKGFGTLIALIPELQKAHPDIRFYIAGSGPLERELKQQIASLGLAEYIVLLGNVPHAKLMEYIRAADCFVLNTGYEGLSHQLLEVLAVGTPIITTDVGGNTELITHESTGLLVPYDNRDALRVGILRILKDKSLAERFVEAGKKFVSGFTVERAVDGALAVLRRTIPGI